MVHEYYWKMLEITFIFILHLYYAIGRLSMSPKRNVLMVARVTTHYMARNQNPARMGIRTMLP